jgi:ligand-binding SRPBCC domain-containing protein
VEKPDYFRDRMTRGAFRSMVHHHYFEKEGTGTRMRDEFMYTVPYGPAGMLFDRLILKGYMRRLLERRNEALVRAVIQRTSSL